MIWHNTKWWPKKVMINSNKPIDYNTIHAISLEPGIGFLSVPSWCFQKFILRHRRNLKHPWKLSKLTIDLSCELPRHFGVVFHVHKINQILKNITIGKRITLWDLKSTQPPLPVTHLVFRASKTEESRSHHKISLDTPNKHPGCVVSKKVSKRLYT